jgi:hypothetical protein
LISLNIFGGRSFNEASQYPFFPWVLSDYESETLDFSLQSIYRDLTKPMGALSNERLMTVRRKKSKRNDYLYSSFATCPLAVYLWLLRMEPFASLHIEMQSGRFDHATRLFSSVVDSYRLASSHLNDYKELPPEFYFQPEFLLNDNEFDLGLIHDVPVGNVILPPWARSAIEFCYLMRKALESDYASNTLSHWIDLFFGCKQSDSDSDNLYLPDIYESIWTKQTINNPTRRMEIEARMCHIGQMPAKLFTHPHPKRNTYKAVSMLAQTTVIDLHVPELELACWKVCDSETLLLVSQHQLIELTIRLTADVSIARVAETPLPASVTMLRAGSQVIGLYGTGRLASFENGASKPLFPQLKTVSYLASSAEYVAFVSDEAMLHLIGPRLVFGIPFYGEAISCCNVSKRFGITVCGTLSGSLVICSLFQGIKTRVVKLGDEMKLSRLLITRAWGFIVTHAVETIGGKTSNWLFVHNVNGMFVRSLQISFDIVVWCSWSSLKGFDYLMLATDVGKLMAFEVFYLNIGEPFHRSYEKAMALSYRTEGSFAVVVFKNGKISYILLMIE